MSASEAARCSCPHCSVHLEFSLENAGAIIDCPQCGQTLQLPEASVEIPATEGSSGEIDTVSLMEAFAGKVSRPSLSFLYRVGLLGVTLLMLILPLIYLALIGAAVLATWWWGGNFYFLVTSMTGGVRLYILKWVCFVGPLFAGAVVSFFMIKPLLARPARGAQALALNPGAEPVLFAFISKICAGVGAPMPERIDLSCHLNASAGFRRGFWSLAGNDLVLTIGLPLVAGLSIRELAGVLAHEFGHFRQGFGMRLSYVIRAINGWFARVVYERDSWDEWLEDAVAQAEDWWMILSLGFTQFAVQGSRFVLKMLMYCGHGASCFLLRQMEYDADANEINLVGSEIFESTTRRIHVLGATLQRSYKNIRVTWNLDKKLPDNLPGYLLHHESRLSAEQREKMTDTLGLKKSGVFDTHPSNGDRIRRARLANQPGVFHFEGNSRDLFSNFDVVARQVTILHYEDDLGIPMGMAKLTPLEVLVRASATDAVPTAEEPPGPSGGGFPTRLRLKTGPRS